MPGRGTEKHARLHRADRGRAGRRGEPGGERRVQLQGRDSNSGTHPRRKGRGKGGEGGAGVCKWNENKGEKAGKGRSREGGKGREGMGGKAGDARSGAAGAPARQRPLRAGRGTAGGAPPAGRHRRAPPARGCLRALPHPGGPFEPSPMPRIPPSPPSCRGSFQARPHPGGPSELSPMWGVPPSAPSSRGSLRSLPMPRVSPSAPPCRGPLLSAFSESGDPAPPSRPFQNAVAAGCCPSLRGSPVSSLRGAFWVDGTLLKWQ